MMAASTLAAIRDSLPKGCAGGGAHCGIMVAKRTPDLIPLCLRYC